MSDEYGHIEGRLMVDCFPPHLGRNGRPEGAQVWLPNLTASGAKLSPEDARRLAGQLLEAADVADRLDERCLPHLEAFTEALEELEVPD